LLKDSKYIEREKEIFVMWSLSINNNNVTSSSSSSSSSSSFGNEERTIIYSGTTSPSILQFSSILQQTWSEDVISDLAVQIVKLAPTKSIAILLSCLACNYWRSPNGTIDLKRLQSISNANLNTVCGAVFKKGDIVWTCHNCAKDPTCVQCNDCFKESDHKGHEVYFHRAGGGGGGCCDCGDPEAWATIGNCKKHNHENSVNNIDPLSVIPPGLLKGLNATLAGVVGLIASYSTCIARGYEPYSKNQFVIPGDKINILQGRIHNDDFHTYDEVKVALTAVDIDSTKAKQLTEAIDHEGDALINTGFPSTEFQNISIQLGKVSNLFYSILPEEVGHLQLKIYSALFWMHSLGTYNDGLRRIMVHSLLKEVETLPDCGNALSSASLLTSPSNIFNTTQFPMKLQHLDDTLPDTCIHPFHQCNRNTLSLLIISSPYLGKNIKKIFNDLIVSYQQFDVYFKSAYTQLITYLYPSLYMLFCRGLGTYSNSILHTTVQIYTSNSMVFQMSTDGKSKRVLENNYASPGISKMLSSTILLTLQDFGCKTDRVTDNFMENRTYNFFNKRLAPICRDLEYTTEDNIGTLRLLTGERDSGFIEDWLIVCNLLQCLDKYKRRTTTHIEIESTLWSEAINICLLFENISSTFLTHAYFPSSQCVATSFVDDEMKTADSIIKLQEKSLLILLSKTINSIFCWSNKLEQEGDGKENLYFQTNKPILCLGLSVLFPGIRKFHVSYSNVSVHLPLTRFLVKILSTSSCSNIDLDDSFNLLRNSSEMLFSLADYPLRALSFTSQVNIGMWKRNGISLANLSYNYSRAPLCKSFRDSDIVAVQTSILSIGADSILALAIDRFELLKLLELRNFLTSKALLLDYQGPLLSELLHLLLNVVTYIPTILYLDYNENPCENIVKDPSRNYEGLKLAVTRKIAHLLLSGTQKIANLQEIKNLIGPTDTTVSDELIRVVTNELVTKRRDMDKTVFDLNPIVYDYFDPEYSHLSQKKLMAAQESVKINHLKLSQIENENNGDDINKNILFKPIITKLSIPLAHPSFDSVRGLLYRPIMFSFMNRCLRLCLDQSQYLGASSQVIIARIVHVFTLQIHCFPEFITNFSSGKTSSEADKYYTEQYHLLIPNKLPIDNLEDLIELEIDLLNSLCDVWLIEKLKEDVLYLSGLGWVLKKFYLNNTNVNSILQSKGIRFEDNLKKIGEKQKLLLRKRLAAQKRTMGDITKQASSFAAMMEDLRDGSDNECDIDGNRPLSLDDIDQQCIYCNSKDNKAIGYLTFSQHSCTARHSIEQNQDCSLINLTYRSVALEGCDILSLPSETNGKVIYHISQSEHILSNKRVGKWIEVVKPIKGWCSMYKTKTDNSPQHNGTPANIIQLFPVKKLLFNKFGDSRIHLSRCGHAMHFDCWEHYTATIHANNVSNNSATSIDVARGEYLCPLCKSICNTIVPHTPAHIASVYLNQAKGDSKDNQESNSIDSDTNMIITSSSSVVNDILLIKESNITSTLYKASISSKINLLFNRLNELKSFEGFDNKGLIFINSCLSQFQNPWNRLNGKDKLIPAIDKDKDINLIRSLHSTWSSISYTILSNSLNYRRIMMNNEVYDEKIDENELIKDISFISQLLLTLRQTRLWFKNIENNDDTSYIEYLVNPLTKLLAGSIPDGIILSEKQPFAGFRLVDVSQCSQDQCDRILLNLPYLTVSKSDIFPDSKRLSSILSLCQEKSISKSKLWGTLRLPLLSQDLHVISIATISCGSDLNSIIEAASLVCLARLIQIFIEPFSTGYTNIDSFRPYVNNNIIRKRERELEEFEEFEEKLDIDPVYKLLEELRDVICKASQVPISNTAPIGNDFLAIVIDSFIPFLEFSYYLIESLKYSSSSSNGSSKLYDINKGLSNIEHTNMLLNLINLPNFYDLLSSSGLQNLGMLYGDQFAYVYDDHTNSDLDNNIPGQIHPYIPSDQLLQKDIEMNSNYQIKDVDGEIIEKQFVDIEVNLESMDPGDNYGDYSGDEDVMNGEDAIDDDSYWSDVDEDDSMDGDNHGHNYDENEHDYDENEHNFDENDSNENSEDEDDNIVGPIDNMYEDNNNAVNGEFNGIVGEMLGMDENEIDALVEAETEADADHYFDNAEENNDEENDFFQQDDHNNVALDEDHGVHDNNAGNDVIMNQILQHFTNRNGLESNVSLQISAMLEALQNGGYIRSDDQAVWNLIGIDPVYPCIDDHFPGMFQSDNLTSVHTSTPLLGSISGTHPIYGLNGERLSHGFADLSHMGIGLRHVSKLIDLPHLYTDIYQMVFYFYFNKFILIKINKFL
jgi:E3 ubiquitin-protein ligase UBR2